MNEYPQGTAEWIAVRIGKITGSHFGEVMSGAVTSRKTYELPGNLPASVKGKQRDVCNYIALADEPPTRSEIKSACKCSDSPIATLTKNGALLEHTETVRTISDTARTYMLNVISEIITGVATEEPTTKAMQWGIDHEPFALAAYENATFSTVEPAGYIPITDQIGCSPDGLVGDDGCVEAKCPYSNAIHVNTLITGEVPKQYRWQVAGHMYVTGREWCDFISYSPCFPEPRHRIKIIRVERDSSTIGELVDGLDFFTTQLNEILESIT